MTRYLAYTSPARGHLYPIVETLRELSRRGHEVHVRTLASEVPALRALGLRTDRIDAAIERVTLDTWRAATPQEGLARALATFAERAEHEIPDLQEAIATVGPDVLMVDTTTVGAAAVADATGIPWARSIPLFQQSWSWPGASSGLTMVPFGLEPAGMEVLNGPRRRLGLSQIADPAEVWQAPLHLYYTAPPFAPSGLSYPESFRLVGPGLWEPLTGAPEWLDELERPLVLVSVSSEFQRDDALIQTALTALGAEDIHLVVTTAAHDPDRFDPPANARLTGWLPHGPLVQRAACVVCHGGMGITQKALASCVPVCVVPFGRDQFDVAHRVTALEAGTVMLPFDLNATRLRSAVQRAMTMRPGARRVAAGFAAAGGAQAAADALEILAAAHGVDTQPRQPTLQVDSAHP